MADPKKHPPEARRASSSWLRGERLQASLLRSHLMIALLGLGVLGTALATVLWTRSIGVQLAEVNGPLAQASVRTLAGLQRSLAGLRGWMALGNESFREERRAAWTDEIEPSIHQLLELTARTSEPETLERLQHAHEVLDRLKEAQWWIEDIAPTPGNVPSRAIMIQRAEPIGDAIETAVTSILDLEKNLGAGADRKLVLGLMADLRFSFARCRMSLRDLVADGGGAPRQVLRQELGAVGQRIALATTNASLLTKGQKDLLTQVGEEFGAYTTYCDTIIATPEREWDVSRNLLATKAAPMAMEAGRILEGVAREEQQRMEAAGTQLVRTSSVGSVLLVLMAVVMAVVATLLSIRSARRIAKPIGLLAQAAQDLADGRMYEDIPATTSGEVADLTVAFNKMRFTLHKKQEDLRESEAKTRAILDTAADGIITIDEVGVIQATNKAAIIIFGYSESETVGENISLLMPNPYREEHDGYLLRYLETGNKTVLDSGREVTGRRKDGTEFPMSLSASETDVGGRHVFTGIVRDISQRKTAEAELEALHKRLMTASRQAGMAEIATGVLHNVGNVLNSVNVSATLVSDKVRTSKVSGLTKAMGLMREHSDDLATFITEDEKGKKLPAYLERLAEHLTAEQESMMRELGDLTKNIDHIKKIVSTQQSHAGASGVIETVSLPEVVDDALTVNITSFERHGIEIVHEYEELPPIALDKQKLMQILVNLIGNAKHAIQDGASGKKRLTLRIKKIGDDRVGIDVIDTGVGISAENLTKIFSHGFTTKKEGHGFGLHSAALGATEMKGALSVHSDGAGTGATFALEFPLEISEVTA